MIFPFSALLAESHEIGLVVALIVGFGFGFVLERAGFGRSTKLAAQFYLHDMTVFKVMFTSIVTAMLGLVIAGGLGLVNVEALAAGAASYTFFWPMLVGGLLLGAGFIISGYCPGTSVVASASGNLDGMVTFFGVVVGTLVYGEAYGLISGFATSSNLGHLFLPDVIGIARPFVALAVTVMAILAFLGAEKVEGIFQKRREETKPLKRGGVGRKAAFATLGAAAVLAVGTALLGARPATASVGVVHGYIGAEELARRVVDEPWKVRVIDLRGEKAWTKARVPGSEAAPAGGLEELGLGQTEQGLDLVLVGPKTIQSIPEGAGAYRGRVLVLEGGFAAWQAFALKAPGALPEEDASEDVRAQRAFQAAVSGLLTGQKAAPPPQRRPRAVKRAGGGGGGGCD